MIKRKLFEKIKEHIINQKEITFIVGPRQSGKTTLMLLLKKHIEEKGGRTLFLNLDIETHKEFVTSQEKLIRKIELEIGKNKGFVFIDEIQRKENAGLFLKGIYDLNLPWKFIVSGSGSVDLKEKIKESLAGRKRIFELSTISFDEFVNFKTNYKYEKKLYDFFSVNTTEGYKLLEEYLNFGGYPRIILEERLNEKLELMNEIYESYITRDISYLLKIHKIESFTNLLKIMASQIGCIVNYSELSKTLGISIKTVKDYLWYLEKTFILRKITPYFKKVKKEIKKAPIYYFYDIGMRNFSLGNFGYLKEDIGFVFQNFIYNLLREIIPPSYKIYFWRTQDKAEVDFVIDTGNTLIPVEVKYKKLKEPEIPRSMRSFIEKYKVEKAFIINLTLEQKINLEGTKIEIVPFYYFYKSKIPVSEKNE
jgi:predicted AAA+ superfamily ATPase